jgi:hypothetical protein
MAKKRKTSKMPAGLRAYWNKKQRKNKRKTTSSRKRKGTSVAKKKRRKSKSSKRRTHRRGHHSGGSIMPALGLPSKHEMESIVGAGVYGWLEGKAAADPEFIMNKTPKPITQVGYAGNIALTLWLVNRYAFKHPYVKALANGAASVALYKMGKAGALFTDSSTIQGLPQFGVSGDDDDIAGELDDDDMGALAAEGSYEDGALVGEDDMEGLPVEGLDG